MAKIKDLNISPNQMVIIRLFSNSEPVRVNKIVDGVYRDVCKEYNNIPDLNVIEVAAHRLNTLTIDAEE